VTHLIGQTTQTTATDDANQRLEVGLCLKKGYCLFNRIKAYSVDSQ
jgi:hypothetical protein